MKLKGKRVAIFLDKIYEDLEFWYPYLRLKEEGADVCVVAPQKETYIGKHGIEAHADLSVVSVKSEEFHALVIPGGYSPDHMRRNQDMINLVKSVYDEGKPVAAICHAGWMLASAEIIKGKKVTSFYSIKDDMINAGAEWIDQDVVKDGNIITSRNPNDLPAFCRTIIETLSS